MQNIRSFGIVIIILAVGFFLFYERSVACSTIGKINVSNTCASADFIVRAVAVKYDKQPDHPDNWTTGVPDSKVEFETKEILKGDTISEPIVLNGYLSDKDDFNDRPVPYDFVRPGGRAGSCFANTYKQGAQYLLFLKKSSDVKWPGITTEFTVNFNALAPVNEQLHSENDAWLFYIKGLLKGLEDNNKLKK